MADLVNGDHILDCSLIFPRLPAVRSDVELGLSLNESGLSCR